MSDQLTPENIAGLFSPDLLDDSECRRLVLRLTRGESPVCPACGIILDEHRVGRLLVGQSVDCRCGVQSSPRTGTILEGSTITDRQLVLILVLLFWEFPVPEIAQRVGCSKQSVYNWRSRLMSGADQ